SAALREASRAGPGRGRARGPRAGRLLAGGWGWSVGDDDQVGRALRAWRSAARGSRHRGARGQPPRGPVHRRGPDGDTRRRVRRAGGQRLRGIPRPPEWIRCRRGAAVGPGLPAAGRAARVTGPPPCVTDSEAPFFLSLRFVDVALAVRTNDEGV